MLLNFDSDNFGSFQNHFGFSMKPGKVTERFEDNVINVCGKNISKVAVIVGENAGGKTSFMRSIDFLKYYIQRDANVPMMKELCYFKSTSRPQHFKIDVVVNDILYSYALEIDSVSIVSEVLFATKINQKNKEREAIFTCQRKFINDDKTKIKNNLYLNEDYITKDISKILTTGEYSKPGLTINLLSKLGIEIISPFIKWINEKLIVKLPGQYSLNFFKHIEDNSRDIEIIKTNEFLEIFSLVDPSIEKVVVDEKDPFRETIIIRNLNKNEFHIKLKDDSTGVNEFFGWAIEIYKVIYENATLFADELDRVLNSILATRVINFIKVNAEKGQFIFSTHNVLHINTIDFMKEQIYFVNKDLESLSSIIYPLSSFKEYRYDKPNVYELYLKGLLGGVPNE